MFPVRMEGDSGFLDDDNDDDDDDDDDDNLHVIRSAPGFHNQTWL